MEWLPWLLCTTSLAGGSCTTNFAAMRSTNRWACETTRSFRNDVVAPLLLILITITKSLCQHLCIQFFITVIANNNNIDTSKSTAGSFLRQALHLLCSCIWSVSFAGGGCRVARLVVVQSQKCYFGWWNGIGKDSTGMCCACGHVCVCVCVPQ